MEYWPLIGQCILTCRGHIATFWRDPHLTYRIYTCGCELYIFFKSHCFVRVAAYIHHRQDLSRNYRPGFCHLGPTDTFFFLFFYFETCDFHFPASGKISGTVTVTDIKDIVSFFFHTNVAHCVTGKIGLSAKK